MSFASLLRRLALTLLLLPVLAHAAGTVPVLMLSDIHFDPFHDPAKFPQLLAAPADKWAAILRAPASATQAADFTHLQQTCSMKGLDTDWALLQSSLAAARKREPHPVFITLSGDLTVHQLPCHFHTLAPKASAAAYSDFAAKVVAFVTGEIRHTFPATPVFFTLGNNDSGCGDYMEDIDSPYLQSAGAIAAEAALTHDDRERIRHEYAPEGDYAVPLPHPFEHTRLLVLQDIFESAKFVPCTASIPHRAGAQAQLAWLRHQLREAQEKHEHAWVMAHIPPGIDSYATLTQNHNVCGGEPPASFLQDNGLGPLLDEYASTVRLALFGHTHMDEVRLFRGPNGALAPGKLVPSITPINGNRPSFTVAAVDPATATLVDYAVTVASDNAGSSWNDEYRYSATYHLPDFSGSSVEKLTDKFSANATEAGSFREFFSAGDKGLRALALGVLWPSYACSLTHDTPDAYRTCTCPKSPKP